MAQSSAIDVLTHPALARLHPTFGHPESPERLASLLAAFPAWTEGRPATVIDELVVSAIGSRRPQYRIVPR